MVIGVIYIFAFQPNVPTTPPKSVATIWRTYATLQEISSVYTESKEEQTNVRTKIGSVGNLSCP